MKLSRYLSIAALLALAFGAIVTPLALTASATSPTLTPRGILPLVASDGTPDPAPAVPSGNLPPPDASYCEPSGGAGSAPPNAVIGTLTIGGSPAPAGTLVQVILNGATGPASLTRAAGGYRVDYATGGSSCANAVGVSIAIKVNSQVFDSGVKVGDAAAIPFLRFNVAVP